MMCSVDDCERPARPGRNICNAHEKARTRRQTTAVKAPNRTASEILTDAALRFADAESDLDYKRARDNLQKAAQAVASRLLADSRTEKVREAFARRKAAGLPVGRPPKKPATEIFSWKEKYKSLRKTGAALGISRMAVHRAVTKRRLP